MVWPRESITANDANAVVTISAALRNPESMFRARSAALTFVAAPNAKRSASVSKATTPVIDSAIQRAPMGSAAADRHGWTPAHKPAAARSTSAASITGSSQSLSRPAGTNQYAHPAGTAQNVSVMAGARNHGLHQNQEELSYVKKVAMAPAMPAVPEAPTSVLTLGMRATP